MPETTLAKKLGIKPGYRLLIVNAPEGYLQMAGPLPEGVTVATAPGGQTFDVVQVFVRDKSDIDSYGPQALNAAKPGGLVWFTYPKKTSGVKTDVNRDTGWDALTSAGWTTVAQVSIDDTWSAGRFRPWSDVKSGRR